jgi:hypothetical protein
MTELNFHKDKAIEMADKLVSAITERQKVFAYDFEIIDATHAEGIEPGSGDDLALRILSGSLDAGNSSPTVYHSAYRLAKEVGIEQLLAMSQHELHQTSNQYLRHLGLNPELVLESWAGFMNKYGQGDPLKIFKDIHEEAEVRKMLQEIWRVGPGKSALILKNLVRTGDVVLTDRYDFPAKIDRHAIRQSIGNGVVGIVPHRVLGLKEIVTLHHSGFEQPLESLFHQVFREERIDPIAFCDAKYIVGQLCQLKNFTVCEDYCPLDCSTLVLSDKRASYFHYPTETRRYCGRRTPEQLFHRHEQLALFDQDT